MLKQLELMVDFNDVIGNHEPDSITFVHDKVICSFEL